MKMETTVNCGNCKKKIKIKIEEIRPGKSKTCPHCNAIIKFSGADGKKIQKALDDLFK